MTDELATPRLQVARLQVDRASVRFGSTDALRDVNLALAPGEIVAVLGASGSGKSTLLRSIAGLQRLDQGTIRLDGVDVRSVAPHERGVGLMFQDHALFPHRDVGANVAFGLRMQRRGAAEIHVRVERLLEMVDLHDMARRQIQTLSGGEQQRVALARALAPEPRLLLLDEPLGALDRDLRERLVAELQRLFRELDLTVVAVTHDQAEAFTLADRIAVMDRGRLVRDDAPAALWQDPQVTSVARLLGFANIAPARVEGDTVVTPWGDVTHPGGATSGDSVLVRPRGVRLHPEGRGRATVVTRAFAGERTMLTLELPAAPPLEAEVATAEAPAVGAQVDYSLDPGSIAMLRDDARVGSEEP